MAYRFTWALAFLGGKLGNILSLFILHFFFACVYVSGNLILVLTLTLHREHWARALHTKETDCQLVFTIPDL